MNARRRRVLSGHLQVLSRTAPMVLGVALAGVLAGCGLGAGKTPGGVQLLVTRDFGAVTIHAASAPKLRGQETAMSLLQRNAKVNTRYGGAFVQGIDGLEGGHEDGAAVDWFYYVNGVEASEGAAATTVHPGDRVWWDRHDWSQTDDVPAVVGSFPEPFLHGVGGKRLPVRVECAEASGEACATVTKRLRAQGVPAAVSALGGAAGATQTLRVAVGTMHELSAEPELASLRDGPRASGVYVRFQRHSGSLALLDAGGRTTQTLAAGAGLIAATRGGGSVPLWAITGTDAAGVVAASHAFGVGSLRDRFAVAVTPTGAALALPRPGV